MADPKPPESEAAPRAETRAPESRGAQVDPKLLEILVGPVTHTRLRYDAEKQELISDAAGLADPIRDGIPIMLQDEARPLTVSE